MAQRNIPIKSGRFRIFNIVLYPTSEQYSENYIHYLEEIYSRKLTTITRGDRSTRIRTLYINEEKTVIHGDFSNAIFIDPESMALDKNTNEIIPSNSDPNMGYEPKLWNYWFFPEYHRLFVLGEASEGQILKFLDQSLGKLLDEDGFEVNTEKDRDFINTIINSNAATKLFVRISYTNNDNLPDWDELIDEQLRNSNSKTVSLALSGTRKNPINISNSAMAKGFVNLSASNGYAEAYILDSNKAVQVIKTVEHPMIKTVSYSNDDPTNELLAIAGTLAGNNID